MTHRQALQVIPDTGQVSLFLDNKIDLSIFFQFLQEAGK
jgi:hypothetical protein